jgi:hypothetical protein
MVQQVLANIELACDFDTKMPEQKERAKRQA